MGMMVQMGHPVAVGQACLGLNVASQFTDVAPLARVRGPPKAIRNARSKSSSTRVMIWTADGTA
eukprot:scaffold174248_cov28-Attheya_sp.AAC.1